MTADSKVPLAVQTAPQRIYLQISDDADHLDEPFPCGHEATWCADSVMDCEVAYVRADLLSMPPADLAARARWHQQQAAECFRKIGSGP